MIAEKNSAVDRQRRSGRFTFSNRGNSGRESVFTSQSGKPSATELRRSWHGHFGELGDIWLSASLIITIAGTRHYFPHLRKNFVNFRCRGSCLGAIFWVTVGIFLGESDECGALGCFKQTRDASIEPATAAFPARSAWHVMLGAIADCGVQVGVIGIKMVVVIPIGGGVKLPRRMAKPGLPVVGRLGHACRRAKLPIASDCCGDERIA